MRAPSLHAGTLEVSVNKSEIISTDVSIAKAMVGNDDIADILPVSSKSLYVLGKKVGTTSLTLYDATGRVISVMDVAVGPDVEALGEQLRRYVPNEQIDAHIANDAIVLSGTVNDPGAVGRAVQIARTFAAEDKVVNLISVGSSQQVMLEVKFAEVSRSAGFDVGVHIAGESATGRFAGVTGSGTGFVPGNASTGAPAFISSTSIAGSFGVLRQSFNIGGVSLDGLLNALETKGLSKTLAQPTLMALSGEKASFLAGGEFPVPIAQASGAGTGGGANAITVEFKPFGVSLGFTPTVLGDRTINMIVEPEVSAIDPAASITIGNITIPGLRTRRASTTLELRDGESFAIAGLLQEDYKTTIDQMPVLGSIPILGALFRSTRFQKGETELLIVVTPHLVAPIKASQVRLPTDAVGTPTAAGAILLGQPAPGKALEPVPGAPPVSVAPAQGAAAQANNAGVSSGSASPDELPVANPTASASTTDKTKIAGSDGYAY